MAASDISGRRVLVTGGAGFIGSHIVHALHERNDVVVLDHLSSGNPENVPDDVTLVEGDVRDEQTVRDAMDGVDLVFHEAALVSVDESVEDPIGSHETNVAATLNVLEAAREVDARVVLASSAAIYGDPSEVPIPESLSPAPTSPYGLQKATIDRYARLYHDLYGLETVALRYFNVYGPRQGKSDYSGVISIFREQALSGGPITVHGDGDQTRDFVHVDDVVRANLAAARTDRVGEAFNVGTGETTSVRELAETVRSLTDTDADVVHTDPREGDIQHSCADTTRATERLGFTADVSLKDGLRALFEA